MKKLAAITLVALVLLGVEGCSVDTPSYEAVQSETTQTLEKLVNVVPDPKEIVRQPEQPPYPCDDPLLMSRDRGAFYTGHWIIYVADDVDVHALLAALPTRLGDEWEERDLGIDVSFANLDLLEKDLNVSVSVQEAHIDGRLALEMIAISRCGTLPANPAP